MPQFGLEFLQEKDMENNGNARLGLLHTAHGDVHTPCFMPVGTVAAMKAMHFDQLKETGAEIMLCNKRKNLAAVCTYRKNASALSTDNGNGNINHRHN